ncbi:MAG: nucleotidyltransferase family protein, partial [Gemmatimonadaceae bacterium]
MPPSGEVTGGRALSPAAQVLLLSAGGPDNDERLRQLLGSAIDWERLCALATRERAEPVLYERLRAVSVGRGALPAGAAPLERLARVSQFRMMHLEQRLGESLAALARDRMEAMLLKGAALALTVYGSFVRRPMSDLDLLLRGGGAVATRARTTLLASGWATTELEQLQEFFEGHHHLPALEDARGTGV